MGAYGLGDVELGGAWVVDAGRLVVVVVGGCRGRAFVGRAVRPGWGHCSCSFRRRGFLPGDSDSFCFACSIIDYRFLADGGD